MNRLTEKNNYKTSDKAMSRTAALFPGLFFYLKMIGVVRKSARLSKRGKYDYAAWVDSSLAIIRALESVGVRMSILHMDAFRQLHSPCVFIGNHMSVLETFVLPGIIQPDMDVTFIVKQSLVDYPVFKHIMRSRDPIVVTRSDPRGDLKRVLEGGEERLRGGVSIIVFPQTTRTHHFDPGQFNSIGVKLAKRAGVPVVPFAVRSDAWGIGKKIKDFGRIDPSKPVFIEFDEPRPIRDNEREVHQYMIAFIQDRLEKWFG